MVNVHGIVAAALDEVELNYDPDCAIEDPEAGVFAWRWLGIDAPVEELGDYGIDDCKEIELCPAACAMLADESWTGIEAELGCGGDFWN